MVHAEVGGYCTGSLHGSCIFREDRNADTGADRHRMLFQLQRIFEQLQERVGYVVCTGAASRLFQNDRKLISARTSYGIGMTHSSGKD